MSGQNKNAATSFLAMASSGSVDDAYSKFVAVGFKHHNPFFEGSADSLKAAMKENAQANPNKVIETKRVISEGEFVVVHSHVKLIPSDLGMAVVHIFRFEKGQIVELWDFGQTVPQDSLNQHGIF